MTLWIAIPGTLVALGAILVACWRFIRAVVHAQDTWTKVAAEFQPNGGDSLRDQVDALNAGQTEHSRLLSEHTAQDEVRFNQLQVAITGRNDNGASSTGR